MVTSPSDSHWDARSGLSSSSLFPDTAPPRPPANGPGGPSPSVRSAVPTRLHPPGCSSSASWCHLTVVTTQRPAQPDAGAARCRQSATVLRLSVCLSVDVASAAAPPGAGWLGYGERRGGPWLSVSQPCPQGHRSAELLTTDRPRAVCWTRGHAGLPRHPLQAACHQQPVWRVP